MEKPAARSEYHHGDLRAALIETGLELTRVGGPQALRLREVTRRVGVTPNAAYRHFANHGALWGAVAAEVMDRMAARMTARSQDPSARTPQDLAMARLRGVGLGYVEFAIEEPGWFQVAFFAPEYTVRPEEPLPPTFTLLLDALDGLVEVGLMTPERRIGAEWSCWSTVHGLAELQIHGPLRGHADLPEITARAVDDILAGLVREVP